MARSLASLSAATSLAGARKGVSGGLVNTSSVVVLLRDCGLEVADGSVAQAEDAIVELRNVLRLTVHGCLAGCILAGLAQRAADPEALDLAVDSEQSLDLGDLVASVSWRIGSRGRVK